ncbi:hypothetical protein DFJ43DRAFT_1227549 [Lentinula guzmanii]|uniref:Uncharacterized protein n=1 Tax=Lentinula guzmanii TaxID=2804957 RepID=A0AA38MW73_9AGAR|nr:hypothetical protein DFJ43DRAFT_1227549 [Lentinula guzmanii]
MPGLSHFVTLLASFFPPPLFSSFLPPPVSSFPPSFDGSQPITPRPLLPPPPPQPSFQLLSWLSPPSVKAVQPERITIEVPEAPDGVPSVGTVAVTQGGTRKGYTVLGSMMGLQRSFQQRSLHAIWVSLRSAKKKEVPERRTEPIG